MHLFVQATITDLLGFHLVSHFALQLVMNTILPPPYGLGGQVLWISVYDTPKIQTSMRLLINDYKMHLNLSENDVQLMTESVFFKQVVTPVRFTRTIFQLVQGAKTGRLKNVRVSNTLEKLILTTYFMFIGQANTFR